MELAVLSLASSPAGLVGISSAQEIISSDFLGNEPLQYFTPQNVTRSIGGTGVIVPFLQLENILSIAECELHCGDLAIEFQNPKF